VLLANRIKLLQQEERRTQKIVEATTRRAEEIERLRQRNEQKQKEKALQRQIEQEIVAEKAQRNYLMSKQQQANTVRVQ
jgi:transposase-like protein